MKDEIARAKIKAERKAARKAAKRQHKAYGKAQSKEVQNKRVDLLLNAILKV